MRHTLPTFYASEVHYLTNQVKENLKEVAPMVEKLQTDRGANDPPPFTPDLPIGASSKPEEHTRVLLRAYQETLDVAEDLPAIVWIRLRGKGLGRFIKVPYLRWFLRYFLSDHIHRALRLLNRRLHAIAALTGESEVNQANRTAVEHYLQGLPPPPYKRLVLAVLLVVLAVAYPLRSLGDITPILNSVTHVLILDYQGATEILVLFRTNPLEALRGTLVLLLALFFVGFPPISTFVLKRLLFNLYPGAKDRLGSIAGRDHIFSVEGLYTLEDRIFGKFGSRRPKEIPFDLLVRVLILVLLGFPLIVFTALLPVVLFAQRWSAIFSAVLAILLVTGFVVRFRRLLIAWRKRSRPSGLPPADHRDPPLHRALALARERLERVTQKMDPFPPLRARQSPSLAFVLGFLFSGVGLGIYFRSRVDLIVPSIVWVILIATLEGQQLLVGAVIGGLWGLLRTVSSNKRL
jgi:hypothetical protein